MADTPIEFNASSAYSNGNGSTGLHADLLDASGTLVEANLQATQITHTGGTVNTGRWRVTYTGSETGEHTLSIKAGPGASYVESVARYVLADTTDVHLPVDQQLALDWANDGRLDLLLDAASTLAGTTVLTESYAADGAAATLAQLLYEILQNLKEFAISGTTKTVKKLDGSTTAATYTLDSARAPTSITRSG